MRAQVGIEESEYVTRLNNLKTQMVDKGIDAALLSVGADVYYFSGTAAYSILLISLSSYPVLFVRIGFDIACRDSWLPGQNIRRFHGMKDLTSTLLDVAPGAKVIGMEKDVMSAALWDKTTQQLPNYRFEDISPLVLAVRMVKSMSEVELIKKASGISHQGFLRCREILREGCTEMEVQCEIERSQRALGAAESMVMRLLSGGGFGVVASGPNTYQMCGPAVAISGVGTISSHPYGASARHIQKGDLVVVDKGTAFHGYHADEARTFTVGKASADQQRFFDIDREIQDAAIEAIKPGVLVSDVYAAAKKVAIKHDCLDYFMGYAQFGVEYVGHGVGLEIDEPPLITPYDNSVLTPGMVLAVEPKLVVPGWGGIQIEDTVVVTGFGHEILTSSTRELVEV